MPDHYIGNSSPNGPTLGQLWQNTATNQLNYFDGTNWVPLGVPGATLNASLHLQAVGVGFFYIPMVNGSIGGTPALTGTGNGRAAMVYDNSNNRLYIYNGAAWKSAAFA